MTENLERLMARLAADTEKTRSRREEGAEVLGSYLATSMAGGRGRGGKRRSNRGGGRPVGKAKGRLGAFLKAIAEQESGGNYGARGIQTKYGQALGKYQILDSNIAGSGGWDKEILGRNISPQKFLSTPRLQEKIARGKLSQYFKRYGPGGAAKAWYAGEGNARTNSTASQYGGPSINDYAASVLKKMRKYQR